jgi:hypothetical protein
VTRDLARLEPPTGGPTRRVQPVTEPLPAGTRLWRVHPAWHVAPDGPDHVPDDGTVYNPGFGEPTRFGPLRTPADDPVPLLYLGATRRAALFETVLHDQMPGSVVDARRWMLHRMTAIMLNTDLDVVALHGAGLRSLGLYAADITHTFPSGYHRATRWAAWLHTHTSAGGLTWTSHQDDDERAYVLFGDRVPADALVPESAAAGGREPLLLGDGDGLDWVMETAASVRIEVIG